MPGNTTITKHSPPEAPNEEGDKAQIRTAQKPHTSMQP